MADIIVERDSERAPERRSNAGLIVGIVAVVLLILAALYFVPTMTGNSSTTNVTTPSTTVPATSGQ